MSHNYGHTYEERIKRLESELWTARYTILNLFTDELRELLNSYYSYESRPSLYEWENMIAEKLLDHVTILPYHPDWGRERAYCPFCGLGSQGPYDHGFAIPEGLRRHITGYGNTTKCPVVEQISYLAREHWNEKFSEKEKIEKQEKERILEERRAKETLYLLGPDMEPKMIDETGYSWVPHRDVEQLNWAESRLKDLGVQKNIDGRVVSYLYKDGELCVYANPTKQKNIEFHAYRLPLKRRSGPRYHSYVLPDRVKNDLKTKFDNFIFEAKKILKLAQ